jgi:glycosyl transferase, family 25
MKALIIHLPHREHSLAHAEKMKEQLGLYGFDVTMFEGTRGEETSKIFQRENRELYPFSIKSRDLNRDEIQEILKEDLPIDFWEKYNIKVTEKFRWTEDEARKLHGSGTRGCFHSHYRAWKACVDLQEPVAIFEDDVLFFRGYVPVEFNDVLILSLGKKSFYQEPYKSFLENPTGEAKALPWRNFSMPGASGYILKPHAASSLVKFYRQYYMQADNAINKNIVDIQIHTHLMGRNTLPEEGNISDRKILDKDRS